MTKKIIRFSSFLLVLSILVINPIKTYASVNGDLSLEDGARAHTQTKEEKEIEAKKIEAAMKSANSLERLSKSGFSVMSNYDPSRIYILNVPVYRQETGYWCGPATVKQVLQFINKTSSSQQYYADKLGTTTSGTDMTVIPSVLNNHQSRNTYVMTKVIHQSNWSMYLRESTRNRVPVILDIKVLSEDGWPYTTAGHFLCTTGYDERTYNSVAIQVSDPHPTYYGTYWYSESNLFKVNYQHFRQSIIW